jgi:hypothetical protein
MNIIELAKQAGFVEYELDDGTTEAFDKRYAKFAALVVANIDPKSFMSWQEGHEAGVTHEREACAVIAETPISGEQDDITMQAKDRVADAIRARGQT